jgi:hypothetical protein
MCFTDAHISNKNEFEKIVIIVVAVEARIIMVHIKRHFIYFLIKIG